MKQQHTGDLCKVCHNTSIPGDEIKEPSNRFAKDCVEEFAATAIAAETTEQGR